jgi:hypothetical protein
VAAAVGLSGLAPAAVMWGWGRAAAQLATHPGKALMYPHDAGDRSALLPAMSSFAAPGYRVYDKR